jgi:D-aminopeptidase
LSSVIEFDEKKVDAIFADIDQCHLPGAAVGIAIGGRPVYRKGFGLASMELPVVLSPSTRMRVYSITKHFTCLSYLLLCEEGKARVDDSVAKYFPELHPVTQEVTMRQLMGHTSGLRDVKTIWAQFSGMQRDVPIGDFLCLYRDIDDLDFAPGTSCSYNNGGFLLLTAAIEKITSQRLEEVLRERVFEPIGMHDTLLRRFDNDFVPNSATMHMTRAVGSFDRSYAPGERAGEGAMVSTVDDMLRWLAHMDAPVVGSAATWQLMKAPQRLANGTFTSYGMGLMTSRYRGVEVLHHGGGGMGANAQMLKAAACGLDIIIMVNRHDVSGIALAEKILATCLPGVEPVGEPAAHALATGTFRSSKTGRVIQLGSSLSSDFLWAKGNRQMASIDGTDMLVEPDDEGVLWPIGAYAVTKQGLKLIGDRESPSAIHLNDFGMLDELPRVQRPAAEVTMNAMAGRYKSSATHTEATISSTDEDVRLHTVGRFGTAEFKLERLANGIWRARSTNTMTPWGGILSFEDDGAAFRFSSFGLRALPFHRVI